jgi:hypothetical protein
LWDKSKYKQHLALFGNNEISDPEKQILQLGDLTSCNEIEEKKAL